MRKKIFVKSIEKRSSCEFVNLIELQMTMFSIYRPKRDLINCNKTIAIFRSS